MEKDEKGTKGNWYTGQMARYPQGNPFAGFEGKRKADSNSCWGCRSAFARVKRCPKSIGYLHRFMTRGHSFRYPGLASAGVKHGQLPTEIRKGKAGKKSFSVFCFKFFSLLPQFSSSVQRNLDHGPEAMDASWQILTRMPEVPFRTGLLSRCGVQHGRLVAAVECCFE